MSDGRESNGGLLGLLGLGMVVCCGLPVLLGTGVAIGVGGIALGSGPVVAAGIAVGLWGWRRRHAAQACVLPEPGRAAGPSMTSIAPIEPRGIDPPE